jgi:hypothetical protein
MSLLALIERECAGSIAFCRFKATQPDPYDNFADQTDGAGIGSARLSLGAILLRI